MYRNIRNNFPSSEKYFYIFDWADVAHDSHDFHDFFSDAYGSGSLQAASP